MNENEMELVLKTGKSIGKVVLGIIGIILLLTVFRPWVSISSGNIGVQTHFGRVDPQVLKEGIHFRMPIYTKVTQMNCQIQKTQTDATAVSKDMQSVYTTVAVNSHIDPLQGSKIYQQIGEDYLTKVINPAIQESVKSITAKYTAEGLISKRQEVADEIETLLRAKLKPYFIVVDDYNIVNFQFSDTFNNAIEAKQEAEQKALKAKQDLARIEVEAKQKVTQAQAEADALRLQKQEVTPELLELRKIENEKLAIEKWNGTLPGVTGGTVPFINVK